jgi:soluble epoxide hydrolase/lipid-phosphate phosphatase
VLDNAKVSAGICVGNDFGSQVCWEAARARPDRFIAVFNVGIPYLSSDGAFVSTEELVGLFPTLGYQLYLSHTPDVAAAEMNSSIRDTIRAVSQTASSPNPPNNLAAQDSFLGPWREYVKENNLTGIPFSGIMNEATEDYMVDSYSKQGFFNTFNGYQRLNRNLTYQFDHTQGNFTINQPTFLVYPTKDPVADWEAVGIAVKQDRFLPNLFNATLPTAHWAHEELPEQYNALFKEWVGNVTFPGL